MYDKTKDFMECFDEIFNDHFIETATDEEIESRFEYLKKQCEKDNGRFDEAVDELEFYCNSFIAAMAGV